MASLFVALPLRVREEPALGDSGRDNGRQNDHGYEERELCRVDDAGVEAEERGDVPNVSPVLMSSVEKAAWRGDARRASG